MKDAMLLVPSLVGYGRRRLRNRQQRERILTFICVAVFCCVCDILPPPRVGLGIAGIVFGLWSIWLGVLESRSTALRFNPIVTYQIWQAATLGLSPLYLALKYSSENPVPYGPKVLEIGQVAYGHALLVVGAFALYLGMKHFQPKEAAARRQAWRGASSWDISISFVVGVAIQMFSPEITAVIGSAFAALSTMALASLMLFALKPPAGRWRSAWVYWPILLLGTMTLLLANARGDSKMMLSFSFAPVAFAALRRLGLGLFIAFGIGFAGLYIILIAPLVGAMRDKVRMDERGQRSIMDSSALGDVLARMYSDFRDDRIGYLSVWADKTVSRLGDSEPVGSIVGLVAADGLLHGAGMAYVPMAFIPRILWHDKPMLDRGRYFTAALGMASGEDTATSSTGQTSAGELYWNFGWPGVVVGMYLVGAALSGAWWALDRGNPTNGVLEMTAFTGATLSFVMGTGSTAGTLVVGCIAARIVLGSLMRVRDGMFRRKRVYRQNAVSMPPSAAI